MVSPVVDKIERLGEANYCQTLLLRKMAKKRSSW